MGIALPTWENAGLINFASVAFMVLGCMVSAVFIVFVGPKRDQLSPLDTFDVVDKTQQIYDAKSDDAKDKVSDEPSERDPVLIMCEELSQQYALTKREKEVLIMLARGRSIPFISDALFISKNTTESHAKSIYRKLDIHSRQELLSMFE